MLTPRGEGEGEGGVGFSVQGCLVDKEEFVSKVNYEESA